MKRVFYLICIFFLSFIYKQSFAQYVSVNGSFRLDTLGYDTTCCALPYYLDSPDNISTCFLSRVHATLPEGVSVTCFAPQYLYNSVPSTLHLLDSGDVWLSFVGQGNWYENVLGFYTFPWGSQPSTIADSLVTVVFPNATLWGYGGSLHVGYRVHLGHFPANTGFGFMLVSNGWQTTPKVSWHTDSFLAQGKNIYYSDPMLNPVAEADTFRHITGLYDVTENVIVMGFEDQNRGGMWQPDNDFNDCLFYLKTNNPAGFDTTGFPPTLMTCDSDVSSGGTGGLESQNLGGKVAQRDFEKIKNGIKKDAKPDYSKLPVFKKDIAANERVTGSSQVLERFMPATVYVPTSYTKPTSDSSATTPYYTTPTDITSLTFAKDVLSVDYTLNNQAKAVALAITTLGKAYNHTKSICDRFRGATLQSTDTIRINGYKFILFAMQQADGVVEYSITFDIGKNNAGGNYYLQSKWLISEYQGFDSVFNFQVWATNLGNAIKLTNGILNNLKAISTVTQIDTAFTLPQTYISKGKRNKGNLDINLTNLTSAPMAQIMFEENKTETTPVDTLYFNVPLTYGTSNKISIPINDGYQYEGHLYVNGVLVDDVYMADGNWSLDYDHASTLLDTYTPGNENGRFYVDSEYPLYRSLAIKANSAANMYAYKFLTSGDEPVNLTNYHSFKFHAKGDGQVTVQLIKNSINSGLANQYQTSIALNPNGQDYAISFDDFYTGDASVDFKANDITAVVFGFDFYSIPTNLNFFVGNLSFSPTEVFSNRMAQSKVLHILPNPNEGTFQFNFESETSATLELDISDVTGRVIYKQTIQAASGKNTMQITIPESLASPSLLMVTLGNNQIKYNPIKMSYAK